MHPSLAHTKSFSFVCPLEHARSLRWAVSSSSHARGVVAQAEVQEGFRSVYDQLLGKKELTAAAEAELRGTALLFGIS